MSAVLAIARREARERRFILAAAVVLSLLAGILAAVPGPAWAQELGKNLVLVLYLAFPVAVSLAVGSSLVGRDLAERRLSFYFSRPLSAAALWAGKFLGGAALVVGAFLCCYVPMAMNVGGASGINPRAIGVHVTSLLGLMALAHVLTTMYRSASRLLVLDLCLGVVFVAATAALLRSLVAAGAAHAVSATLLPVAIAAATVALLAAAAAQLAYGRADARRGHVALSAVVWTLAILSLGALALWRGWVLGVTPTEVLEGRHFVAATRGNVLFFMGDPGRGRAGFSPAFMMDVVSGAYGRLAPERLGPPAFAGDGSQTAWVARARPWWWYVTPFSQGDPLDLGDPEATEGSRHGDLLVVARLAPGVPAIEERALVLPGVATTALAANRDGSQVVLSGPSSVFLVDTASARSLARAPLPDLVAADFVSDRTVRLYQKATLESGRARLRVLDWNPRDGSRIEKASVTADDARLMLLARRGDLAVVSAGTGAKALVHADGTVRWLESGAPDFPGAALVLSSGGVALSLGEELRIVTPNGDTVSKLLLEPRTRVYALREPAAGEVAVGLWTLSLGQHRTVFVDAATGAVRREVPGLLPAGPRYAEILSPPDPGSAASRLLTDLEGRIVLLDPDGRPREIVARR